jgi:hypothetical protein
MSKAQHIPPILYVSPHRQQQIEYADLWRGMAAWWVWYAVNDDGQGAYYDHEPFIEGNCWGWDGGATAGFKHGMAGFKWQACIYYRPIAMTEDEHQEIRAINQAIEAAANDIGAFVSRHAKIAPHN